MDMPEKIKADRNELSESEAKGAARVIARTFSGVLQGVSGPALAAELARRFNAHAEIYKIVEECGAHDKGCDCHLCRIYVIVDPAALKE